MKIQISDHDCFNIKIIIKSMIYIQIDKTKFKNLQNNMIKNAKHLMYLLKIRFKAIKGIINKSFILKIQMMKMMM